MSIWTHVMSSPVEAETSDLSRRHSTMTHTSCVGGLFYDETLSF